MSGVMPTMANRRGRTDREIALDAGLMCQGIEYPDKWDEPVPDRPLPLKTWRPLSNFVIAFWVVVGIAAAAAFL